MPLAFCGCRDLFNAAFLSCWSELSEDQQDELIRSIELALTSQDIAEVTQTLLNLAEFMEHSDKVGFCQNIAILFSFYAGIFPILLSISNSVKYAHKQDTGIHLK